MDIVFIRELMVETVVGVHAWEQQIRQSIVIDLDLATDAAAAARGDDLGAAIDYSAVADTIKRCANEQPCRLVETLAERIAKRVMDDFHVSWLKLTLSKPRAVPGARTVGVRIERGKRSA